MLEELVGLICGAVLEQYNSNHTSSAPVTTHPADVEAIKQTDLETH